MPSAEPLRQYKQYSTKQDNGTANYLDIDLDTPKPRIKLIEERSREDTFIHTIIKPEDNSFSQTGWHGILLETDNVERVEAIDINQIIQAIGDKLSSKFELIDEVRSSYCFWDEEDEALRIFTSIDRLDYDIESLVFEQYYEILNDYPDIAFEFRVIQGDEPKNIVPLNSILIYRGDTE